MNETFKKITLGSATAVGALALAIGAPLSASATVNYTFDEGHVDVVHVGIDSLTSPSVLTLGVLNEGDPDYAEAVYPADESELLVPYTAALGGYVLPESETVADTYGVLYAGFSGSEDLLDSTEFDYGDDVTVTLSSWSYTPAAGQTNSTTFSIVQNSTSDVFFDSTGDAQDFEITTISAPESFHEHATWTFQKPGTYTFNFTASGNGYSASLTPYTFVVG